MYINYYNALNIGSNEIGIIGQLADIAIDVSRKKKAKNYDTTKPQGLTGQNSDNTLKKKVLCPALVKTLRECIAKTYPLIAEQVNNEKKFNKYPFRNFNEIINAKS